MLKRNYFYKMNVDGVKDAGSDILVGTITKIVTQIIGGITLSKVRDLKEDLIINPNRQDKP